MLALLFALIASTVTDGDTFVLQGGERIRIANIDAPEIGHAKCDAERNLGLAAKARLQVLIVGIDLGLARQGQDRYGRTLALVSANGRDVGEVLIAEHLAVRWDGHRHAWC